MKTKSLPVFLIVLLAAMCLCRAQEGTTQDPIELLKLANSLKYQQGEIKLRGGLATLTVPKDFNFLGPEDAQTVLVKLWHNPPNSKILGLLIPAGVSPLDTGRWAVVVSFDEDGYVKDDDASKINYDDLMAKMKESMASVNEERRKQGYAPVELIGWAEPPHYDAATHKLYWAKELKFANAHREILNYNIRMLGRRGVLVLNAIAPMEKLDEIEKQTPQILAMVDFDPGHRYVDFDPNVDKVATYGLAALVAGGIATKLGLFKLLWVGLLAAKKFVILGIAAVAAWFKKLFSRSKTPAAGEPPSPQ